MSLDEATVTQISPLMIKTDHSATSMPAIAVGGYAPVVVGERVAHQMLGARVAVLGLAKPDKWHVIGASGEIPFLNSWVNFSGSGYTVAQYIRDQTGLVRIEGLVGAGTTPIGQSGTTGAMFTLPAGYRPLGTLRRITAANGTTAPMAHLNINADGGIGVALFPSGATNLYVSIDVTFQARQ